MSIVTEITRINTNIANSYTAVDNKGGTLPQTQNSANLPIAINSIEVIEQATAEGESLSLANTKAMPYKDYKVKGKSTQATSTQSANLFDEEYYNNNSLYDTNVYKYTKTRIKGNRALYIQCALKSGKTAISGLYVALSSATNPNNSGTVYRWFINNGNTNQIGRQDFTGIDELYFVFYPANTNVNDIFDNYNLWVSIDNINYIPFTPNSPSSDYPSEIHSVADDVNLLPYPYKETTLTRNGITYTDNKDGTITINGTATGGSYIILTNSINWGDSISGGSTGSNIGTNGTYAIPVTSNSEPFMNYNSGNNILSINVISGVTVNNYVFKPKIQKGTVATPYSPYNQGTVTIKQRGKNLFDGEIELGNINPDNGSLSNSTTRTRSKNFIKVEPNTTYSYSHTVGERRWIIGYTKNKEGITDGRAGYNSAVVSSNKPTEAIHFTTTPTTEYIKWYDTNCTDLTERVQLEQGSQATPYEPYQGNDYTFQTEPLRSLPNGVKDTIEADGIHRRVGRVILDGTEDWDIYNNILFLYVKDCVQTANISEIPAFVCNNFTANSYNNISLEQNNNYIGPNTIGNAINQRGFLFRNNANFSTIEEIKTWLSTHNTEVIYPLAEEIIEPLTQNQATTMLDIIKTGSYEGTTNIYTDEDVKPTMKAGYYKKG